MNYETDEQNRFLVQHASCLLRSFRHWTGRELLESSLSEEERARALFYAPFGVVSHNTASDPIFNYANRTALSLFEMSWEEFTALPSRLSAEPVHREDRTRLLSEVSRQGYIADYRGIRIAKSGRRFWIEEATVWNLLDEANRHCGQAAMFSHWRYLDS